jgi:hypothetical protein
LGLPADFLTRRRTDQRGKYGTDAYDQWSVDELLLAKGVAAQAL